MSNLLPEAEFKADFAKEFADRKIEFQEVTFSDSEAKAYAFFVHFETESTLTEQWSEIRNFIAYKFQANVDDEFCKWNIYLFFILPIPISLDIKYKIENDTFSSRKVVIENNDAYDTIIADHLLNSLPINTRAESLLEDETYKPDELLYSLLKDIKMTGKNKVNNVSKEALETIIETVRKQTS
jgi:hypothetical protein